MLPAISFLAVPVLFFACLLLLTPFFSSTHKKPTDAAKVEKLNISDHAVMDEHVGAGGAVERAEAMFKANPNLTMGMVNAETNAGTHHMTRAVQEGADLNDWFNCGADWCSRLHFRTASFCTERSGHYDAFDQGISFFLPNMTWLQPPGYVHQMINQTWQPHGVDVQVNDTTDASASAQISSDGRFLVVRLTNSGNDVAKVRVTSGLDWVRAMSWTNSKLSSETAA